MRSAEGMPMSFKPGRDARAAMDVAHAQAAATGKYDLTFRHLGTGQLGGRCPRSGASRDGRHSRSEVSRSGQCPPRGNMILRSGIWVPDSLADDAPVPGPQETDDTPAPRFQEADNAPVPGSQEGVSMSSASEVPLED